MAEYTLSKTHILDFARHLKAEERAGGPIKKYLRDMNAFEVWLAGRPVTKKLAALWKARLLRTRAPGTFNAMLAAVNALFRFLGWEECRIKTLRLQRQMFRAPAKELTREEYSRLLNAAQAPGRNRLFLLLETIYATSIRVSEVRYITVEALRTGRATVSLKGKSRSMLVLPALVRMKDQPGSICMQELWWTMQAITTIGGLHGSPETPCA